MVIITERNGRTFKVERVGTRLEISERVDGAWRFACEAKRMSEAMQILQNAENPRSEAGVI